MKYVLIWIIVSVDDSLSIESSEFGSLDACQSASRLVTALADEITDDKVVTECVPYSF